MENMKNDGERMGHLADGASPHTTMNHSLDRLQTTFNAGLNRERAINCSNMDSPWLIISPSPLLHCNCPLQASEPSSCTVTGRRCWLTCCVDFGNGHHHSHSSFCHLTIALPDSAPVLNHSIIGSSEHSARNSDMVQHRMRSRRGGTRGGSSRPQTEPNPEPTASSPSYELFHPQRYVLGRYADTRSRRGHALSPGVSHGYFAVHSASFPLPPHPASHSTQFSFCSTLNRPVITATITILFAEDNEQPATQEENSDLWQEEAPKRRNSQDIGKNLLDEGNFALHGKNISGI